MGDDASNSVRFSLPAFILMWTAFSLAVWTVCCLLALLFLGGELGAGLVPAPVLLGLALMPVLVVTLAVQAILYAVGRSRWPESPNSRNFMLYLGTPLVSLLVVLLLMQLLGGADSFIPRL